MSQGTIRLPPCAIHHPSRMLRASTSWVAIALQIKGWDIKLSVAHILAVHWGKNSKYCSSRWCKQILLNMSTAYVGADPLRLSLFLAALHGLDNASREENCHFGIPRTGYKLRLSLVANSLDMDRYCFVLLGKEMRCSRSP